MQGATVAVNYVNDEASALAVVKAIEEVGGQAEAIKFDVRDSKQVDEAIGALVSRRGKLDILVASAGISIDGLLLRLKDDDFEKMMAINVRGALASARAAIKVMARARYGRVIFVSSVVGEAGSAGQTAYAATKAALGGMAKSLAREYGSRAITVNVVSPGFIETDMTSGIDEDRRKQVIGQVPVGRLGAPEDVASAIAYLSSEEAAYVTGQQLRVNGGMYV
jgi:3-oxoacyl-[acyl-carrier protein] reductase